MTEPSSSSPPAPECIAERYEIRGALGRGGMARVYLAHDTMTGRTVALKALQPPSSSHERARFTALFEREFHTLSQLKHPRVIAVYDYGVSTEGPFYTMELLDGGDVRDRGRIPWRECCVLFFDVCSSLALLHSRRLLHRDISPRNIRCTRDGRAKLIDFGAMSSMGPSGPEIVGTPAFTAPECVQRVALDARVDLFSFGATLYVALTGQVPYPARSFSEALSAWNTKPLPPSALATDIPDALDDLVLSLIQVEPALRPQSAFDVMQRLAALAGIAVDESSDVRAAYLATPALVGRDRVLEHLRKELQRITAGQGSGVLLRAVRGLGRTRLLDECALIAKTLGIKVLRASATGEQVPFGVAEALFQQIVAGVPQRDLLAAYPELFVPHALGEGVTLAVDSCSPERLQQALARFTLTVSRAQPLLVAVDDVQRIDAASAAVLATLIDKARRGNLMVVLTAPGERDSENHALEVLARRCSTLVLAPLALTETRELLGSIFGDVANLELLATELQTVALGNPRHTIELAQHLVDRELIRYTAGSWALPERLQTADLPRSVEEAVRRKLARLSPEARRLGQLHALSYRELLSDEHYQALRQMGDAGSKEHAVTELLDAGAVAVAGKAYTLSNQLWAEALSASLDADTAQARHAELAELFRSSEPLATLYHAFAAGHEEDGLRELGIHFAEYNAQGFDPAIGVDQNVTKLALTYQRALAAALELGRPLREIFEIRRWTVALSTIVEGVGYWECAPVWRDRLVHDSGLDLWRADPETTDPTQRLTRALQGAYARHLATPEHERVYAVDEAIRLLAEYVVMSIVTASREFDGALIDSLPALLEPFAPLSPMLEAIWQNAIATQESSCQCRFESAHARWKGVLAKLEGLSAADIQHLDKIRNAVVFGIGVVEAQLGMASAVSHAARLEEDPYHKLSAITLRKIVRLAQGDWEGAERFRREADVLSLHLRTLQMFKHLIIVELIIYGRAGDLAGVQQALEQMRPMAAKYPAWDLCARTARAGFELARGDLAAARAGYERCIAESKPDANGRSRAFNIWVAASGGLAETLLQMGQAEEARTLASAALEFARAVGVRSFAEDLARILSLAEAKLGDYTSAAERLDALLREHVADGVTGLRHGLSCEARARIAIWAGDRAAFEHHARLAAREYGRGARSPVAARYEQLMNEALRAGFAAGPALSDFAPTAFESSSTDFSDVHTAVLRAMTGARRPEDRAKRAIRLLCEARMARAGHLYIATPSGVELAASHGAVPAPSNLVDLAREHLSEELARSGTMTEVVSMRTVSGAPVASNAVVAGGMEFEMLLLSCVVNGSGVAAGVAAVAHGEQRGRFLKQAQLLSEIATHLVESGDATGILYERD